MLNGASDPLIRTNSLRPTYRPTVLLGGAREYKYLPLALSARIKDNASLLLTHVLHDPKPTDFLATSALMAST